MRFFTRKNKKNSGFTLIELMISLFIIVSLGTVLFSIFFTTLRGTKKSATNTRVRENGNYAISQMTRGIQYAQVITCNAEPQESIDLLLQNNTSLRYSCPSIDPGKGKILSALTSSTGTKTSELIDRTFAQVVDGSCRFTCFEDGGSAVPKRIKIEFTLEDVSLNEFAEDNVSIPFQTSVVLRNTE